MLISILEGWLLQREAFHDIAQVVDVQDLQRASEVGLHLAVHGC